MGIQEPTPGVVAGTRERVRVAQGIFSKHIGDAVARDPSLEGQALPAMVNEVRSMVLEVGQLQD
jgi:hypothetical protein